MSIDREAVPVLAGLLALSIVAGLFYRPAALVPLALLLFCAWFFRDPRRETPELADALISPADGKVIEAGPGRVSIFLNIFNVHICRSPYAGQVQTVAHHPGDFLAAWRDEASEQNERARLVVSDGRRQVAFTLVAGLVARRIVCRVEPGRQVRAGERIGLIRFGSRVDVELPAQFEALVRLNQRVVAGETVLARCLPDEKSAPGPSSGGGPESGFPI